MQTITTRKQKAKLRITSATAAEHLRNWTPQHMRGMVAAATVLTFFAATSAEACNGGCSTPPPAGSESNSNANTSSESNNSNYSPSESNSSGYSTSESNLSNYSPSESNSNANAQGGNSTSNSKATGGTGTGTASANSTNSATNAGNSTNIGGTTVKTNYFSMIQVPSLPATILPNYADGGYGGYPVGAGVCPSNFNAQINSSVAVGVGIGLGSGTVTFGGGGSEGSKANIQACKDITAMNTNAAIMVAGLNAHGQIGAALATKGNCTQTAAQIALEYPNAPYSLVQAMLSSCVAAPEAPVRHKVVYSKGCQPKGAPAVAQPK